MTTLYLSYVGSVLGSSVSKSAMSAMSAMSAKSAMNVSNLFYNTTTTTISTLTSKYIQSNFSANQENENNESAFDDKSIIFITGGIFLGLFITSLGLIIKLRKKKEIEKRDNAISNPTYDIIKETDEFYEEPQLNYDLASNSS